MTICIKIMYTLISHTKIVNGNQNTFYIFRKRPYAMPCSLLIKNGVGIGMLLVDQLFKTNTKIYIKYAYLKYAQCKISVYFIAIQHYKCRAFSNNFFKQVTFFAFGIPTKELTEMFFSGEFLVILRIFLAGYLILAKYFILYILCVWLLLT